MIDLLNWICEHPIEGFFVAMFAICIICIISDTIVEVVKVIRKK